jgi:hypothetical protein
MIKYCLDFQKSKQGAMNQHIVVTLSFLLYFCFCLVLILEHKSNIIPKILLRPFIGANKLQLLLNCCIVTAIFKWLNLLLGVR